MAKLSPFDFINTLNSPGKKNLMEDDSEAKKAYLPYIINRQLSYFEDTILLANEMNASHKLDNQMQYDFYRHTIRPRKRFAKWVKPDNHEDLATISKYYGIDLEKARVASKILNSESIQSMREALSRGGLSKDK